MTTSHGCNKRCSATTSPSTFPRKTRCAATSDGLSGASTATSLCCTSRRGLPTRRLPTCANGALYSLERTIAEAFHRLAARLMPHDDESLQAVQAMMMLAAFAAWGAGPEDLDQALAFYPRMTTGVRRRWAACDAEGLEGDFSWTEWCQHEALKRYVRTCCGWRAVRPAQVSHPERRVASSRS